MNRLPGTVSAIASEGGISLIDVSVGKDTWMAMLVERPETAPYLRLGEPVWVLFKETEVSLGKGLSGRLSLGNRMSAVVRGIRNGALLAEVELDYQGYQLTAIITRRAVERLELVVGDGVEALVKANEVMLGENGHES